ncbi:MAG: hypothetical protein ACPGUD_10060 [Parashewanella sp.]
MSIVEVNKKWIPSVDNIQDVQLKPTEFCLSCLAQVTIGKSVFEVKIVDDKVTSYHCTKAEQREGGVLIPLGSIGVMPNNVLDKFFSPKNKKVIVKKCRENWLRCQQAAMPSEVYQSALSTPFSSQSSLSVRQFSSTKKQVLKPEIDRQRKTLPSYITDSAGLISPNGQSAQLKNAQTKQSTSIHPLEISRSVTTDTLARAEPHYTSRESHKLPMPAVMGGQPSQAQTQTKVRRQSSTSDLADSPCLSSLNVSLQGNYHSDEATRGEHSAIEAKMAVYRNHAIGQHQYLQQQDELIKSLMNDNELKATTIKQLSRELAWYRRSELEPIQQVRDDALQQAQQLVEESLAMQASFNGAQAEYQKLEQQLVEVQQKIARKERQLEMMNLRVKEQQKALKEESQRVADNIMIARQQLISQLELYFSLPLKSKVADQAKNDKKLRQLLDSLTEEQALQPVLFDAAGSVQL